MKLLFDEDLSPKLAANLNDLFPGSQHVFHVFPAGTEDEVLWIYARTEGFAIVSRDSDFAERCVLRAGEVKVIWIRAGNCLTSEIEGLLRTNSNAIDEFHNRSAESYLVLHRLRPKSVR